MRPGATAEEIANNALQARRRLAAAGGAEVDILAVTKGHDADLVRRAMTAGFRTFAENYAQELDAKVSDLAAARGSESTPAPVSELEWHFIGRLQRNKVRRIASLVTRWDSVDRRELIDEIANRSPSARILVQVNVSDEPGKGGCEPDHTAGLVARAVDAGLAVEGLMTVGRTGAPTETAVGFRRLRGLCDQLGLAVCSMGMSADFEVAVSEGSTQVRLGSALFGLRPPRGTH